MKIYTRKEITQLELPEVLMFEEKLPILPKFGEGDRRVTFYNGFVKYTITAINNPSAQGYVVDFVDVSHQPLPPKSSNLPQ